MLYTKVNLKGSRNLNVRAQTIRLSEENTRINLRYLRLDDSFLVRQNHEQQKSTLSKCKASMLHRTPSQK